MDLSFLAKADQAALQLEIARSAFEQAKAQLEFAKQAFEELLPLAEEHGIPRAKLKKLTEDRVRGLMESGVLEVYAGSSEAKRERPRKAAKKSENLANDVTDLDDSAFRVESVEANIDLTN